MAVLLPEAAGEVLAAGAAEDLVPLVVVVVEVVVLLPEAEGEVLAAGAAEDLAPLVVDEVVDLLDADGAVVAAGAVVEVVVLVVEEVLLLVLDLPQAPREKVRAAARQTTPIFVRISFFFSFFMVCCLQ